MFDSYSTTIIDAAEQGAWYDLTNELVRFVSTVGDAEFIKLIISSLSADVANELLRSFSVRFVPFSGWSYVVIGWLLSIKRHWRTPVSEARCPADLDRDQLQHSANASICALQHWL